MKICEYDNLASGIVQRANIRIFLRYSLNNIKKSGYGTKNNAKGVCDNRRTSL